MSIALVLVNDRWHLVFAHSQYQLLHFQAAMVINGVVISDLAILIVQFAMEIEGLSDTDAGINEKGVIRRINIQLKTNDAVAAMDAVVRIRHLAGLVVCRAIESIALTVANVFCDNGLVIRWPVIKMQINGLVASVLGLRVMLICIRCADRLAIEVVCVTFANGFVLMGLLVRMHHDADAHVL